MNLIRATKDQLQFHLSKREQRLLVGLLDRYPCLPAAHQPLTKTGDLPDQDTSERLLNEALAEHRQENKKQWQTLLADRARFEELETGWRLSLSPSEVEWLLQILNDIRIGSWVLLGSPEERLTRLDANTARHFWAMETAGLFQMQLLAALEGGEV